MKKKQIYEDFLLALALDDWHDERKQEKDKKVTESKKNNSIKHKTAK
ncbi:hypothetical protein, partial [Bacillus cereus]